MHYTEFEFMFCDIMGCIYNIVIIDMVTKYMMLMLPEWGIFVFLLFLFDMFYVCVIWLTLRFSTNAVFFVFYHFYVWILVNSGLMLVNNWPHVLTYKRCVLVLVRTRFILLLFVCLFVIQPVGFRGWKVSNFCINLKRTILKPHFL